MQVPTPKYAVEMAVVGDTDVGKTCLLLRYRENIFKDILPRTIGVDLKEKRVVVNDTLVILLIWDVGGMERFRSSSLLFYRDTQVVMVVYDVSNRGTFDNVRKWMAEVRQNVRASKKVKVVLVGNKVDDEEHRAVSEQEGQALAEELGMDGFFEASAKTGVGVWEAFTRTFATIVGKLEGKATREIEGGLEVTKGRKKKSRGGGFLRSLLGGWGRREEKDSFAHLGPDEFSLASQDAGDRATAAEDGGSGHSAQASLTTAPTSAKEGRLGARSNFSVANTHPSVPSKPLPGEPHQTAHHRPLLDTLQRDDRVALQDLQDTMRHALQNNLQLTRVMSTIAAHDRTLQMLVHKEKECPSLFWFQPKRTELRDWLRNPAKRLFQDTLIMMVVCPVTLCVVPCGPHGGGWELSRSKDWVRRWGPAILLSVYVLQAAVAAGRVAFLPLPPVPSVGTVKRLLGLSGSTGSDVVDGIDRTLLKDSLSALTGVFEQELGDTQEARALKQGLQEQATGGSGRRAAAIPLQEMVGDAYRAIHKYLVSFGPLEDQLAGHMKRVRASNGDMEWVSLEGEAIWLQKHAALAAEQHQEVGKGQELPSQLPCPPLYLGVGGPSAPPTVPTAPSTDTPVPAAQLAPVSAPASQTVTWLSVALCAEGMPPALVEVADRALIQEKGLIKDRYFAAEPVDDAYLRGAGITVSGLLRALLDLHDALKVKYGVGDDRRGDACSGSAAGSSGAAVKTVSATSTEDAPLSVEDREFLRKLKLQYKANTEPFTTHPVERGRQLQYTETAYTSDTNGGHQAAGILHKLEVRTGQTEEALREHMVTTAVQLEVLTMQVSALASQAGSDP